jgi:predicted transcriptional regulator
LRPAIDARHRLVMNAKHGGTTEMTKLLERAIAKARDLPAEDQDSVAVAMLAMVEETPIVALDDETRAAIREGLEQARRGEFIPDAEIEALWKRHGL